MLDILEMAFAPLSSSVEELVGTVYLGSLEGLRPLVPAQAFIYSQCPGFRFPLNSASPLNPTSSPAGGTTANL
jgi:hypothetical protein